MTKWMFLIAGAIAVPATPARADDFQQWLVMSTRVKVAPGISVQHEMNARFSQDRGGLYQLQNSLLVGYAITESITAWGGYLQSHDYRDGDFQVERRARQQVTIDNFARVAGASFNGRIRLEQRWRDDVPGTGWRLRPRLGLSVPLGDKAAPSIVVTSEAFLNLNTTSFQTHEGLDRTRTAALLSVPLRGGVRLDAGYLNQHRFVPGGPDSDDHAITAAINLSL